MSKLISSKEALIALADGEEVEFENPIQNFWVDIKSLTITEIEGGYYVCSDDDTKVKTQFRRKPHTITLNGIEVPAPFEPTRNQKYFYLHTGNMSGYANDHYEENLITRMQVQLGAWRTEEEIKQVVEALRSIFK